MSLVPNNRVLFWTLYAIGTFGPLSANFLLAQVHQSHFQYDSRSFLSLWLVLVFAAGSLIACAWSVRSILFGGSPNSQSPVWLYRAFGWLALAESLLWVYAVMRVV